MNNTTNQFTLHEPRAYGFKAKEYLLHQGLKNAIEVAFALGQPLLLTGEPGTGKTKLAFKVAAMLAEQDDRFLSLPLVFNTKTTSNARDLFYTYDALAHFQASNIKEVGSQVSTANFIELQALGRAIVQTNPNQLRQSLFKSTLHEGKKSSVVLIDEIDKAPRDFSNDILNEIENYEFEIREQENTKLIKGVGQQILVIMTSNSEKNLPDAFLRRCVFYHIPFPDKGLLFEIVKAQIVSDRTTSAFTDTALKELIGEFENIRKKSNRKKPATAELLSWIRILGLHKYMEQSKRGQKELMLQNLSVLVKTQEDLEAVQELLKASLQED